MVLSAASLVEVERIKRLKYAYLRCLDQKRYDELRSLLTDDATASYGGGRHAYDGADAIVAFIVDAMGDPAVHSSHRCHHPEIDLVSAQTATGTWALEDTVIDTRFDVTIQGAAFYEDRYQKADGHWLISHTGYRRTFEEIFPRASIEGLRLTASWWFTDGRSELG
ncbi:MAG: nuclear transport factor 2 family protein [Acidimicrobiales bacterium]